jgi:hypothetical protein
MPLPHSSDFGSLLRAFGSLMRQTWGLLPALLTAVQRPVLSMAPDFAFDAPRQGTCKSLLTECCADLATGELPQAWPLISNNEDEVRKRILTAHRSGARVMLWDNIVGQFDNPALAVLLTSSGISAQAKPKP